MDKQYFIRLHNQEFEVSKGDYVDFYKEKRRVKYLYELDMAHGTVSYQAFDSDSYSGEEYIVDTNQEGVEDAIVKKLMIEHLHRAMESLTTDELFLITALFFENKSERELSKIADIPQKTINDRKKRILQKLKNLLET